MYERMEFPKEWKDFIENYKITDTEKMYTNGIDLIPVFRVEQMIAYYFKTSLEELRKQ